MDALYLVVASANTQYGHLVLSRWSPKREQLNTICVTVDDDVSFLKQIRNNLSPMDRLLIITNYPPMDGLKGNAF